MGALFFGFFFLFFLSQGGRMAECFTALDFNAVTQVEIPL